MHKFTVQGQGLSRTNFDRIVSDTVDYLEFSFAFSPDWDGIPKYANFRLGDGTPHSVEIVDGVISAGSHVNLSDGNWQLKVVGLLMDGETVVKRIITGEVTLRVEASNLADGETFPNWSGEVGAERLAQVTAALASIDTALETIDDVYAAKEAAEAAQAAAESAKSGALSAQGGSVGAMNTAVAAKNAAEIAKASAESANASAQQAKTEAEEAAGNAAGAVSTHNADANAHAILARKTETMRLLISRTIGAGENVSAITWTQDDAGNALALIDAEISIYVPQNTLPTGSSGYLYLRLNGKSGASDYNYYTTDSASQLLIGLFRSLIGTVCAQIKKTGSRFNGFLDNRYSDGTSRQSVPYGFGTNFDMNAISSLYLYLGGISYFPEGTVIEIYGRTA